jgi:16S rRNA (guanine1207-N2)-methyltransferase
MATPRTHLFDTDLLERHAHVPRGAHVLDLGFHDHEGAVWAAARGANVVALRPAIDLATGVEALARARGATLEARLATVISADDNAKFDIVLMIAPFYLGNGPVRSAFAMAARALRRTGTLWFQAHRRHGAETFAKFAAEFFTDVSQVDIGTAQVRLYKAIGPRPTGAPGDVADAIVTGDTDHTLTVRSTTVSIRLGDGVFGSRGIDPATTFLLDRAEVPDDASILDLGCGAGPIGIALAAESRRRRVVMSDVSKAAVDLATANAVRNGILRIKVLLSDGLDALAHDRFDVILSNLPAHRGHVEDPALGARLIAGSARHLVPSGTAWFVVTRARGIEIDASRAYRSVDVVDSNGRYKVVRCASPRGAKLSRA